MARGRPRINRPDDIPTLEFELFNTAGNKVDAVVYMPDERLLVYDGKYYRTSFEEGWEVTELFLSRQRLIIDYKLNSLEMQDICESYVKPNADQEVKLTRLFQQHGMQMAEAAKQMEDAAKRMKTIAAALAPVADAICPGFDVTPLHFKLLPHCAPFHPQTNYGDWEAEAATLLKKSSALSTEEPFLRKRKASEDSDI